MLVLLMMVMMKLLLETEAAGHQLITSKTDRRVPVPG